MSDTPKRMWHTTPTSHTEYIRKDIADELAEALKECWDAIDEPTGPRGRAEYIVGLAALTKYKETET